MHIVQMAYRFWLACFLVGVDLLYPDILWANNTRNFLALSRFEPEWINAGQLDLVCIVLSAFFFLKQFGSPALQ